MTRRGILPVQDIREAVEVGMISAAVPITESQLQPASLDLRLGRRAWRVQSSFLPGTEMRVEDKLDRLAMHQIDLDGGAVLERGCVYIVELQERLALQDDVSAMANPKSSTGRLDIFTRLITDGALEFEAVASGYQGPLFAEISPRTFSVLVRPGSRLSQLRLRRGPALMSDDAMKDLQRSVGLVSGTDDVDIRDGVALSVNLAPASKDGIIGWRARKHAGLIDIDAPASCQVDAFWERLTNADLVAGGLVLHLMNSTYWQAASLSQCRRITPLKCGPMIRASVNSAHYAGFFDPGFGMRELGAGSTRAVLECGHMMCSS